MQNFFFGGGGGGETMGFMVCGKMVNTYRFTSLPCNLLHSIFETPLHSSFLHKKNVGCKRASPSYSNNY